MGGIVVKELIIIEIFQFKKNQLYDGLDNENLANISFMCILYVHRC